MSNTIDQKVVEMRFDNKHFESNVSTTMSTLDKLKQSLNLTGATKGFENINAAAGKVDLSAIGYATEQVGLKFNALYSMADQALRNITTSAMGWAKNIVSALTITPVTTGFNEYELKMGSIQTIMASTGEDINTVNKYLNELNEYSDKTIYSFSDMTQNIGKFTNAGVKLDDAVSAIQGISNVAAVSGANANEASRAMYNFAQALSAGHVKLIDWKSIENANMATVEFKEYLLEAAVAAGTLTKTGEGLYETLEGNAVSATRGFNESLQDQWMTTEVLVSTLKDYSDETTDIGKKAFAAAQDIKTFSQLFDTLKESAQSGWAGTWELLVGDLEEAKDTLTEISELVGGWLGDSAKDRNDFLTGGLTSGYKQLLGDGITDVSGFEKVVKKVGEAYGVDVDGMIEKSGSLEESFKEGWLTEGMLTDSVRAHREQMEMMSDAQLKAAGLTKENVEQVIALDNAFRSGQVTAEEYIAKITRPSGRENLMESLLNTLKALESYVKPIKEAFTDIFPPATAEQLYSVTEIIRDFTAKLTLSEEVSDKFRRAFRGIFAILDIGKTILTGLLNAIAPLFGGVSDLSGGILDMSAKFGDWLVNLSKTIKNSTVLVHVFDTISWALRGVINVAKGLFGVLYNTGSFAAGIVASTWNLIAALLERIGARVKYISSTGEELKNGLSSAFSALVTALENSGIIDFFKTVYEIGKTMVLGVIDAIAKAIVALTQGLSSNNFSGLFDIFNSVGFSAIIVLIAKFIKTADKTVDSFGKLGNGISGFLGHITGIFDAIKVSITDCFKSVQEQIKAKTLMEIAKAIAVLVAALFVLSLIESNKLLEAVAAVSTLFAELMMSMKIFSDTVKGNTNIIKASFVLITMSVAVLLLSSALAKIGRVGGEGMAVGVVGIAALMMILVKVFDIMNRKSTSIVKGAGQMVLVAFAINTLMSSVVILSFFDWTALLKGVGGVTVLVLALATAARIMSKESSNAVKGAGQMILMAGAVAILAGVCHIFAKLDWVSLGKGAAGIAAMGGVLAGFMFAMKAMPKGSSMLAASVSLLAVTAAIVIMAKVLTTISAIDGKSLAIGLASITAMAGVLAAFMFVVKVMPKGATMLAASVSLIAVASAMVIMSHAMKSLGGLGWEGMGVSLITLGGAMIILSLGLHAMNGTIVGSAALLVASAALAVMAPVLTTLGGMSWESIAHGLVAIAGAFAVLGIAGYVLAPAVPAIIGLASAFTLIGVGILAAGAGIVAAGAGVAALAGAFIALAEAVKIGLPAIVEGLTAVITVFISFIPVIIEQIGYGLVALCGVIAQGAPAFAEAIKALILSLIDVFVECVPALADGILQLITGLLAALASYTPMLVDLIFQFLLGLLEGIRKNIPAIVESAIGILLAVLQGIVDGLKGVDGNVLMESLWGIGVLAAIMSALALVAALIPAAMLGVLGMGLVIAELSVVLAAIGAISSIPGLNDMIGKGGTLLETVGNAIGSFIGGIIGGAMGAISNQLPGIGTNLSQFMTNLQPFIEGSKDMNISAVEGVRSLAETILILTAANVLDGLTSWFTGGVSLATFGEELAAFGPSFRTYCDSVAGIDGGAVEASANAALALAEMASKLPNSGGVVGWFAGENSLAVFADELAVFGPKLKAYADSVVGLDAGVVTNSANAALALAEMANNLPNQGGAVGWFTGDNTLGMFAAELAIFGPLLKTYAEGLSGLDTSVVTNSANAASAMAAVANSLPNQGGCVSWFTGDNTLSKFGAELARFGPYFKTYSDEVSGVKPDVVKASASAATALANLAKALSSTGGLKSLFTGDKSLGSFGKNLKKLGEGMADYSDSLSGVNTSKMSGATTSLQNLVNIAKGVQGLDFSGMKSFASSLGDLGKAGVSKFIDAFSGASKKVATAARNMIDAFLDAANSKAKTMSAKFKALAGKAADALEGEYQSFYDAGAYLVEGFADGISKNTFMAEAKAAAMAAAAAEAAAEELDENSPSKVGYAIGDFFGVAFANAIGDNVSRSYDAGSDMANAAKAGLSNAVKRIKQYIDGDIEAQPTIRPVLDLSEVQAGANTIGGLFGSDPRVGVLANVGAISSSMSRHSQNGEVVSAIDKLRKSMGNVGNTSYNINGIEYEEGSDVSEALRTIVRAAKVERRK